jgi:peptide/nickel transport system ATP-binding protein/oligopeptide transport system ATP-binding protein
MSVIANTEVAASGRESIITVRDLRVLFPTRDGRDTVKAIDGMDFEVRAGETFGVIGESGSGKTTRGARSFRCCRRPKDGSCMAEPIPLRWGGAPSALIAATTRSFSRTHMPP